MNFSYDFLNIEPLTWTKLDGRTSHWLLCIQKRHYGDVDSALRSDEHVNYAVTTDHRLHRRPPRKNTQYIYFYKLFYDWHFNNPLGKALKERGGRKVWNHCAVQYRNASCCQLSHHAAPPVPASGFCIVRKSRYRCGIHLLSPLDKAGCARRDYYNEYCCTCDALSQRNRSSAVARFCHNHWPSKWLNKVS